tara:strand:+ start:209 stop:790 length:582 start_codon:yes stop_codon:yes gene_type:complete
MINGNFTYWGPLLYFTKISNKDVKTLLKNCKKDIKFDARKQLAGIIEDEYNFNFQVYQEVMAKYIPDFLKAWNVYYNEKIHKIEISNSWVNYMKAGESNPNHIHTECDLSSVLYLQVPQGIKKENKQYIGTSRGPGMVNFTYGDVRPYNTIEHSFMPEVGQLFIFPFNLEHSVNSFKSKGERISLATNFNIIK